MTDKYTILNGLKSSGHAYISASESVIAKQLESWGFVKIWLTTGGFPAWEITSAGRYELKELESKKGN